MLKNNQSIEVGKFEYIQIVGSYSSILLQRRIEYWENKVGNLRTYKVILGELQDHG